MSADYVAERLEAGRHLIPGHMFDAIQLWVLRGISGGSFLTALLRNDFMGAMGNADEVNAASMRGWATFLYNYVPSGCYGSPEKVKAWAGVEDAA